MENKIPLANRIFQRRLFFLLIFNILMFALGGGIAHYLGFTISWTAYMTGQGVSIMLMTGAFFLDDYFGMQSPSESIHPPRTQAELDIFRKLQASVLIIALSVLTVAAILIVFLGRDGQLNGTAIVLLSVGFLALIAYAVPPFRLVYSGIGELLAAILMSDPDSRIQLLPAVRGITPVYFHVHLPCWQLSFYPCCCLQFTTFASDCKNCQNTLLVRLGWQKGWHLNNILLILGFYYLSLPGSKGCPGPSSGHPCCPCPLLFTR